MLTMDTNRMLSPAIQRQPELFAPDEMPVPASGGTKPFRTQLLKWIGNKQKQADSIIGFFPKQFGTYLEPFLGSGGVLGVLAPKKAVASDTFAPLVQIWQTLHDDREELKRQYAERHALIAQLGKKAAYDKVLASYNRGPNGADLLFLCRACYGGVVRFRKNDGYMSTPVGVHDPVSPESFGKRADIWHARTSHLRVLGECLGVGDGREVRAVAGGQHQVAGLGDLARHGVRDVGLSDLEVADVAHQLTVPFTPFTVATASA